MSGLRTAAVILNWNNWPDTKDCIKDFKDQNSPVDIVVVDNGSSDHSVEELKDIDGIYFIDNHENAGYGRGNNVGIEYAKNLGADIILVVNNDIHLPTKDFITNVQNSVSKLPDNWGYLGFKIINIDGTVFQYNPVKTSRMFDLFVYNTMLGIPFRPFFKPKHNLDADKNVVESEVVSGSCFAFNAKAVKKIGAFDPFTFLYGEERILAIKYQNAGWNGFIDRSIEAIHNESATTSRISEFVYVQRLRSEIYYFKEILKESKPKLRTWLTIRYIDSFLRVIFRRITPSTFQNTKNMYHKFFTEGK